MLEDYDIDVIQSDNHFDATDLLNQGDFVIYFSGFMNELFVMAFPVADQYLNHTIDIRNLTT
ncbi:MAG: hypothetical protein F6K11_20220 [Leptolyngbya sp. SIO3F4]|nr:hypothetical protein [Leptolyngbya sp. SIO3F4]